MKLKKLADRIGQHRIPGSSTSQGTLYHDIPFVSEFPLHRKSSKARSELITKSFDVRNKTGLDLGCSVGGISFYLDLSGAKMIGVDYDLNSIDFAHTVTNIFKAKVHFLFRKIEPDFISQLTEFDFIIWLNQWMWFAKQYGLKEAEKALQIISTKTGSLFFSTSQNDGKARIKTIKTKDDVRKLLEDNTDYKITDLGVIKDGKHFRTMFYCQR